MDDVRIAADSIGETTVKTRVDSAFAKIGPRDGSDATRHLYRRGPAGEDQAP
ncbi:hypothetical protein [Microbispora siamensis]|uniref:HTH luxR-type domain-containing protein n=1 Tax=Microbispora siamensis TaxID=564413 RepID=A0ABQ4GYB6_9ACTN|nr:hypothetical protein [Microbispora siamensis]GIH66394.1 hypothetical protein Msi02_72110 [Microbispora siamensis]